VSVLLAAVWAADNSHAVAGVELGVDRVIGAARGAAICAGRRTRWLDIDSHVWPQDVLGECFVLEKRELQMDTCTVEWYSQHQMMWLESKMQALAERSTMGVLRAHPYWPRVSATPPQVCLSCAAVQLAENSIAAARIALGVGRMSTAL
jgi:hypothetical protein